MNRSDPNIYHKDIVEKLSYGKPKKIVRKSRFNYCEMCNTKVDLQVIKKDIYISIGDKVMIANANIKICKRCKKKYKL